VVVGVRLLLAALAAVRLAAVEQVLEEPAPAAGAPGRRRGRGGRGCGGRRRRRARRRRRLLLLRLAGRLRLRHRDLGRGPPVRAERGHGARLAPHGAAPHAPALVRRLRLLLVLVLRARGGVRVPVRLQQQRGGEADLAVVEELVGGAHGGGGRRREARREVEVEVEVQVRDGGVLAAGGAGRRAEEEVGRVGVPVPVPGGAGRRAHEGRRAGAVVAARRLGGHRRYGAWRRATETDGWAEWGEMVVSGRRNGKRGRACVEVVGVFNSRGRFADGTPVFSLNSERLRPAPTARARAVITRLRGCPRGRILLFRVPARRPDNQIWTLSRGPKPARWPVDSSDGVSRRRS
jgi:hypothetical protein